MRLFFFASFSFKLTEDFSEFNFYLYYYRIRVAQLLFPFIHQKIRYREMIMHIEWKGNEPTNLINEIGNNSKCRACDAAFNYQHRKKMTSFTTYVYKIISWWYEKWYVQMKCPILIVCRTWLHHHNTCSASNHEVAMLNSVFIRFVTYLFYIRAHFFLWVPVLPRGDIIIPTTFEWANIQIRLFYVWLNIFLFISIWLPIWHNFSVWIPKRQLFLEIFPMVRLLGQSLFIFYSVI